MLTRLLRSVQGESNVGDMNATRSYASRFPAMIDFFRAQFQLPDLYFGWVQLSTWCIGATRQIAEMRQGQVLSAGNMSNVGWATNADHGAGCTIHMPPKQYIGKRLANSALALEYKKPLLWKSPQYKAQLHVEYREARAPAMIGSIVVEVALQDVSSSGLTTDVWPSNYLPNVDQPGNITPGQLDCWVFDRQQCVWASIHVEETGWMNASVTVGKGGRTLLLSTPLVPLQNATVLGTAYGWGNIPFLNAYDKRSGLPVLGWNSSFRMSDVSTSVTRDK